MILNGQLVGNVDFVIASIGSLVESWITWINHGLRIHGEQWPMNGRPFLVAVGLISQNMKITHLAPLYKNTPYGTKHWESIANPWIIPQGVLTVFPFGRSQPRRQRPGLQNFQITDFLLAQAGDSLNPTRSINIHHHFSEKNDPNSTILRRSHLVLVNTYTLSNDKNLGILPMSDKWSVQIRNGDQTYKFQGWRLKQSWYKHCETKNHTVMKWL